MSSYFGNQSTKNVKDDVKKKDNAPKKNKSFKEAFREAKDGGSKTFEFPKGSGKMFSTTTRDEVEASRKSKNIGASSDYSKASSSYQDAPKPSKVKKDVSMPSVRSTAKDDSDKVKGTTNVKTEQKKKGGNPLFMKKGGYVQSKGGAAGGVKKKKVASNASSRADGIVKKGRTKGRMI